MYQGGRCSVGTRSPGRRVMGAAKQFDAAGGRLRDALKRTPERTRGSRLRDARLRAHSRHLLQRLELPFPFSVTTLCEQFGELRGTPVRLLPWELPADGPFGMLLSRDHEDVIVYQANTTTAHQAHIILHEIGHLISYDLAGERPEVLSLRTCYSSPEERDAEVVASTIMRVALTVGRRVQRHGLEQPWRSSVYNSIIFDGE